MLRMEIPIPSTLGERKKLTAPGKASLNIDILKGIPRNLHSPLPLLFQTPPQAKTNITQEQQPRWWRN